jgi:hypothetical protein
MLAQKNVESVLFKERKMGESTNMEKLELFGGQVIKDEEIRRKSSSILGTMALNQTSPSPRTSSATTLSTLSSSSSSS